MVSFLDAIRAHAVRTPEAVALRTGSTSLSYRRLDARIDRLAHALTTRGVGREKVCAIALEPGPESVVAVAAVLRAGGAFLTLDVTQPQPRLAAMVHSAGATSLLTRRTLRQTLSLPVDGPVVELDELYGPEGPDDVDASDGVHGTPDGLPEVSGRQLAYVSHTSGSTGSPNAVLIERAGLDSYLGFIARDYGLGPHTVALQVAPLGYDASIRDTFAPLVAGGTVVLAERSTLLRADSFAETLREYGVNTLLSVTPSFLTFLSQQDRAGDRLSGLRLVVSSGESLLPFLSSGARRVLPGDLVNQYGPSECTMTATRYAVPSEPETTADLVGTPVDGMTARLIGPDEREVPPGETGEIALGGIGVARGYRGLPALTADRFRPDPGGPPGARAFRTGDLARSRPDGVLEYLGRSDRQVKIRGYRVDPAEIEGVLLGHPRVTGTVVTAEPDDQGRVFLYAHVTGDLDTVTDAELRRHLAGFLPTHMMPRRFHRIERLPTTRTGKADRAALRGGGPSFPGRTP
ncbi:amino acid adenylation domain-containing protein [Streptomyces sp. NRRL S-4]|uniref:amino acid adenylation domain-containing protein n=1 Tax=Streptomyces sp. NRRL S-4 TaxID=1519471 RepID=UPI0006B55764|nr:amino acid adenylation domain-containing protein [Streptomyces sp. NRRL S-4]KPC78968.1 thioester reductase [Streptomyces sp. NRRL S-4]